MEEVRVQDVEQKSRAGFSPGPVGPPSEATNVHTRKPSAK